MNRKDDLLECIECGGRVERRMVTTPIKVGARTPVPVRRRLQRCVDCGQVYFGPGEGDDVYRTANEIIRAREHLLRPDEIRAIRIDLGLSQTEFERLLRVGPKTVVRWERGTIFQNRATDTLLRTIRDVPQAREYLLASLDRGDVRNVSA
jgi:HTH-type transcriptional regulator/antitoxin MqsA